MPQQNDLSVDGAPGSTACRKCGAVVVIHSHHVAAGDTVVCGACGTTNLIPADLLEG